MKKLYILLACIIITAAPMFAKTDVKSKSCAVKADTTCTRAYAEQLKKERAAISNALQLSDDQSRCRIDMVISNTLLLDKKFNELEQANIKLRILNSNDENCDAIKAQKREIAQIKKDIKTIVEDENKEFKKMLNHEQRVKLRMIQKLQRLDARRAKHQKNYLKRNPKMREFAPHIKAD